MSGGERQMLAMGRALMARPRVLMLDEPSLGLAPRIVREIFAIVAELKTTGVSILLIEQNARAALQIADWAYVMELGEIVMQGPAAELAGDKRVIESYLGLGQCDESPAATPSTMLRMVPLPTSRGRRKAALSSPAEGGGGGPSEGRWRGQARNRISNRVIRLDHGECP